MGKLFLRENVKEIKILMKNKIINKKMKKKIIKKMIMKMKIIILMNNNKILVI